MGQLSRVLRNVAGGGLAFWCPGCREMHVVWVGEGQGPRWGWNGSAERPTFTPSVLVTWNQGEARVPHACHSFVTDGRIQFLGDCTHELAGQTVDMVDIPATRVIDA